MLLKVLLAGGDKLDGDELEATVLEARDDGTNEATLRMSIAVPYICADQTYLDAIGLDSNEAITCQKRLPNFSCR